MGIKRYILIAWAEFVRDYDPDTKAKAAGAAFAALLVGLTTAIGYVILHLMFTYELPSLESIMHAAGFSGLGGAATVNHVPKHAKKKIEKAIQDDETIIVETETLPPELSDSDAESES